MANLPKDRVKSFIENISKEVAEDAYNIDIDFLTTIVLTSQSSTGPDNIDKIRFTIKDSEYDFIYDVLKSYTKGLSYDDELIGDCKHDLNVLKTYAYKYIKDSEYTTENQFACAVIILILGLCNDGLYKYYYAETEEIIEQTIVKVVSMGSHFNSNIGYLDMVVIMNNNLSDINNIPFTNLKEIIIK